MASLDNKTLKSAILHRVMTDTLYHRVLIKKDFKMSLAEYILKKLIQQMRDKERG
jgi:hypothetical protein